MDNFDKLASFTPQAVQETEFRDVAGLGNIITGGGVKANRELEKLNIQHRNNLELAKWNAHWNKAMDDTKAQRHMLDLQKAGINPILAHGQTLANAPTSGGASAGSAGATSDKNSKLGKAIKMLATLVLKSF